MRDLAIEYREPGSLTPSPTNARTHSRKQIEQIARSIRSFGFNNPVLLDSDGQIIAGHGRVAAAVSLGLQSVPTVRLDHLSPAQKRAYIIADNRLAELAGWDEELLSIELQGLIELDLDFEICDTGFELQQIDLLIEASRAESAETDEEPISRNLPSLAQPGDLWQLGDHFIFCGDALDPLSYEVLLRGERADRLIDCRPPPGNRVRHQAGLSRAVASLRNAAR